MFESPGRDLFELCDPVKSAGSVKVQQWDRAVKVNGIEKRGKDRPRRGAVLNGADNCG